MNKLIRIRLLAGRHFWLTLMRPLTHISPRVILLWMGNFSKTRTKTHDQSTKDLVQIARFASISKYQNSFLIPQKKYISKLHHTEIIDNDFNRYILESHLKSTLYQNNAIGEFVSDIILYRGRFFPFIWVTNVKYV